MIGRRGFALFTALALTGCTGVDMEVLGDILETQAPLNEATVAAGLREALEVSTGRGVDTLSSVDGFLGNAMLRILIPEQFETVASTLRKVGLGTQVDEFEVAMNRAAERASAEARPVFWDEIRKLSIADAFGILNGGEHAATELFRQRTESELEARFLPIVQEKMEEVGLYNLYGELADRYNAIPFVTTPALDLDAHVTDGALDGLFTVLGKEEARIRQDPIARSTELLRRVFGSR
jgi:hypothetical protein